MAPLRSSSNDRPGGLRQSGDDAFQLTLNYLKQETLEPLKGLGRFLAFGVAGSLAIAVGVLLGLVGILRLLQEETGTALTGDWSWVPYFVVCAVGAGVAGVAAWRITAGPGKAKLPQLKSESKSESESESHGTAHDVLVASTNPTEEGSR